jgi:hypothetical protein
MVNGFPVGAIPLRSPLWGTAAGPTGHDCFAFGDDVLDRHTKVGESSAVESRSLLFTLRAAPKIGCPWRIVLSTSCNIVALVENCLMEFLRCTPNLEGDAWVSPSQNPFQEKTHASVT